MDSEKLLKKGKLIQVRPHTRFVNFPKHRHNYVEVIYMCQGTTTHILNGSRVVLEEGDLLFLNQNVSCCSLAHVDYLYIIMSVLWKINKSGMWAHLNQFPLL